MKMTITLLIFTALVITPASLFAYAESAPEKPDPSQEFVINAAGASFPYPLIDLWRVEYNNEFPNIHLNYQSIGSGGGVKQHIEKTVNFAASDAPLKPSESQAAPGTLQIPETIGGVIVTYNLPEVPDKGLRLTGDTIADIYLGKITRWNDQQIAQYNPELALPDQEIVLAKRSDGSGTTFVFTDYLSATSPEFHEIVGKGKSVPWPSGVGAAGNEGVAGIVRSTPYSIGYVELAYAFQTGMSFAFVQNADGTAFVEPTLETISAASTGAADTLPTADGDWSKVTLVNAPGPDSYPIASFSYLLVYDDLSQSTKSVEEAKAVLHMIHWMITDGQKFSESLLYVPLPDAVVEIGKQGLDQIEYEGQKLSEYSSADGMQDDSQGDMPGGGCLVATAVFGSELAPQVQFLREVRDSTVMSTSSGSAFMAGFNQVYYSFSPAVADMARENPIFGDIVRAFITPMVSTLSIMAMADPGSEADVLGLGISVIMLNLGMYVAAPALIGFRLHRYLSSVRTAQPGVP